MATLGELPGPPPRAKTNPAGDDGCFLCVARVLRSADEIETSAAGLLLDGRGGG